MALRGGIKHCFLHYELPYLPSFMNISCKSRFRFLSLSGFKKVLIVPTRCAVGPPSAFLEMQVSTPRRPWHLICLSRDSYTSRSLWLSSRVYISAVPPRCFNLVHCSRFPSYYLSSTDPIPRLKVTHDAQHNCYTLPSQDRTRELTTLCSIQPSSSPYHLTPRRLNTSP